MRCVSLFAAQLSVAHFAICEVALSLSVLWRSRELASIFREFPHKAFQLTTTAVSVAGTASAVAAASLLEWRWATA